MENLHPSVHATTHAHNDDDFAGKLVPLEIGWIVVATVVGVGFALAVAEVPICPRPTGGDGRQSGTEAYFAAATIGRFPRQESVFEDRVDVAIPCAVVKPRSFMGLNPCPHLGSASMTECPWRARSANG